MESAKKKIFCVRGMHCAGCAANLQKVLLSTKGIYEANVNFATSTATLGYDETIISLNVIQQTVRNAGFDLLLENEGEESDEVEEEIWQKEYLALKRSAWGAILCALPVFIIGMFFMHIPYGHWTMLLFTIPVVAYFGIFFYIRAWRQLKHGMANMDTLVAVSTGVSFLFSLFNTVYPEYWVGKGLDVHVYYEATAVIIALVLLGRLLEQRAKVNTFFAVRRLMNFQPHTVTRVDALGREESVNIGQVVRGDRLLVKPGERIPVDGTVNCGNSFVDESMITGESIAIEKMNGSNVFAGTINQKGSFRFIAEKIGKETLLAAIIKNVKEAQSSKAPIQRMADRVAAIFVPAVLCIALFTFIIWMIIGGETAFPYALQSAVTVLVIACPCALGLATPMAMMVGIGKSAEHNILIKDAEGLEILHKVDTVVLDKTGTITEGKPEVCDIYWHTENNLPEYRAILQQMEKHSEHPLADAVVNYLKDNDTTSISIGKFESISGQGIRGEINDELYFVGNLNLLTNNQIVVDKDVVEKAEEYYSGGNTVMYFANKTFVLAVIACSDKIKADSAMAIREMKEMGIAVYMQTGDHDVVAGIVAKKTGVENYRAALMPSDKAGFVVALQREGRVVAVVGDGINDSEALARADISIAMGQGADMAMHVAQLTLMNSSLKGVPIAVKLSRLTVRTIRQNLFWAFIYNIIGIPLAAGVLFPINGFLLNPMIAAMAMTFSSLSVILNSLRIRKYKLIC